jgi:tetratricopeptide (TPR) repeat protein
MRTIVSMLLVLSLHTPALAQSGEADALIEQGLSLRREHRDEEALALFRRAHELTPSPRALAQIALAEQATGLWVEAHAHLSEALAAEGDAWISARRDALRQSLAAIEQRLGRLEIRGDAAGAEIYVDGTARGTMPLAEPLWVPAGRIVIEIRSSGHHPFNRTVEVSPAGHARVLVELVPTSAVPTDSAQIAPTAEGGTNALPIVGGVSLGLGAIALGVGIGFHVARESDAQYFNSTECEQAETRRGDVCPDTLSAIRSSEIGMGVGYVAGGVLAIVGVIVLSVGTMGGDESEAALSCGSGPGEFGVACAGRF